MRARPLPSAELVKHLFDYDPKTGVFTRRVNWKMCKAGEVAGYQTGSSRNKPYLKVGINGVHHLLHRLAWLYVTGKDPVVTVDHIDGNGLNNAFANLRLADMLQQNWNRAYGGRSAHPTGVRFHANCPSRPWQARLKKKSLGYFATVEEAAQAYQSAYLKAAGEYAHTAR